MSARQESQAVALNEGSLTCDLTMGLDGAKFIVMSSRERPEKFKQTPKWTSKKIERGLHNNNRRQYRSAFIKHRGFIKYV